jgi:hypothetical protein
MKKTTADLIMLAGTGANLVIDASEISTADIIQVVGSIGLKGSHITICNSHTKSTADLILLTMNYPKNITFDLVERNAAKD